MEFDWAWKGNQDGMCGAGFDMRFVKDVCIFIKCGVALR